MTTATVNASHVLSYKEILSLIENNIKQFMINLINTAPKILTSVLIFLVALVSIKYVNRLITFIMDRTKFEEFVYKITGTQIPLTKMFIIITDIGIVLVAIAGVLNVVAPDLVVVYRQGLDYFARLASVIVLSIVSILGLNAIISFIRIEEKIKSFVVLIAFLMIFAFLIDLTALSNVVKNAIVSGISIGIGVAIGAFAIWFLFGEYIERVVRRYTERYKWTREASA